MNKKAKQLSTSEHLLHPDIKPEEAIQFLEDFRSLLDPDSQEQMKPISMRVPPRLLSAFKYKAKLEGKPYQKVIKELMFQYLKS